MSLREVSGQLLSLQEEERRRIARELHDSAGQTLAALSPGASATDLNVSFLQKTKHLGLREFSRKTGAKSE
jgi:signal transduction histidine kinase